MPAHSVERRNGAALPMNVVASSMTEWSKTAVSDGAAALRRAPRGMSSPIQQPIRRPVRPRLLYTTVKTREVKRHVPSTLHPRDRRGPKAQRPQAGRGR